MTIKILTLRCSSDFDCACKPYNLAQDVGFTGVAFGSGPASLAAHALPYPHPNEASGGGGGWRRVS